MFIAFIIIFSVVGYTSYKFNSLINPEGLLILQCSLVLLFSAINWLTIPLTMVTFPNVWGALNPSKYAIFILDFIITLGYIIWRHT